jgi:hypothetical protein
MTIIRQDLRYFPYDIPDGRPTDLHRRPERRIDGELGWKP